jgi:hypothetical protein
MVKLKLNNFLWIYQHHFLPLNQSEYNDIDIPRYLTLAQILGDNMILCIISMRLIKLYQLIWFV